VSKRKALEERAGEGFV